MFSILRKDVVLPLPEHPMIAMHMLLSERISLMIRGGYVGRNPNTGKLQQHLQNGYERLQKGD
ncbi:AAA family ATPase, partial [Acinetobacter baumannii]|nr:AAA family ATPase [Acinetobacter baumannii]